MKSSSKLLRSVHPSQKLMIGEYTLLAAAIPSEDIPSTGEWRIALECRTGPC